MPTTAIKSGKLDGAYLVKSIIGIFIMIIFRFIPAPNPITPAGMALIGEFIGMIFLWVFVDMMWPTFLGMVLFGLDALVIYPNSVQLSGVYEAGMQSFGNWITVFVLGTMLICYCLEEVGTLRRICMKFITSNTARKSPWKFTFMFMLAGLVISLFLDVTPAQFFMLGIAHEMFNILGFKKGDRWPRYIIIMITFSAVIGFAMTPICHTLPILWMSIYSAITQTPASIASYIAAGLPVGAIIWILMMVWMKKVIKVDKDVPQLDNIDWSRIEAMKPGKMEKREKYVIVISILLLCAWIVPSIISLVNPANPVYLFMSRLSDSSFLFLAIVLLAIVKFDGKPVLDLTVAFQKINWLPVVLLAGIMMVAGAMGEEPTGIPAAISMYIVPLVKGMSPYAMVALICVLCVILTNIANNVPVGIIFVSAGVPMCLELGLNPFPLALGVCVAANLAFTIPPAYVPVGVAYADPYCNGKTVFKNGLYMCLVSIIVTAVLVYPIANLVS